MKYLTAAANPAFWPVLTRGVMPAVEHIAAMRRLAPKSLIDVGANKGQFSVVARHLFPQLQIHAFEPLNGERDIFKTVVRDPVRVYPAALGRASGEAAFFLASRADSSSLLPPGAAQQAAYGIAPKACIRVPVAQLSDLLDVRTLPRPTLLKVDVQGGELEVLEGMIDVLSCIDMIYCEASFVELYEGQPLANTVIAFLSEHGFAVQGVFNQSETAAFGPTQADFLFMRARAGAEKAERRAAANSGQ